MPENRKKIKTGVVVSDKMKKTIVVKVERSAKDPLYNKIIRRYKKFKAHDEDNSAKIGDTVRIMEARPLSKDKRWRLLEIVNKSSL